MLDMMRILNSMIERSYILQALKYHIYSAPKISKETARVYLDNNYTKDAREVCTNDAVPMLISMIDGSYIHGGFTDRIRGILATYKWAKEHGYVYKINWVYPYKLEDYLYPNSVDWRITPREISYNTKEACPICIFDYKMPFQGFMFRRLMSKFVDGKHKQYHVYSNINGFEDEYKKLFDELFIPSAEIQTEVNKHISLLGKNYISFTFRFQELLGDFKEQGSWVTLDDEGKRILIKRCIDIVREIYETKGLRGKILVTSDSSTFLAEISKKLNFVYTISGRISHMDFKSDSNNRASYMRSFIDFFLLARASSSYLVCCGGMYRSNFAKYASLYGEHEYQEIIRK